MTERPERVLVVDDEDGVRNALVRVLGASGYEVQGAANAAEAASRLEDFSAELLLCDVNMPGRSGIQLVEELSRTYPDLAVVMVTGVDDAAVASVALEQGAYGYVIKPFERNEILINAKNALRRRTLELENVHHREQLEDRVAERTADLRSTLADLADAQECLQASYEETIQRLAYAAEHKDPETGHHLQRMSRYSGLLGTLAGLDAETCNLIRIASPMHDIGKIGIPDAVLYKPGAFDDDDRAVMSRHPTIGGHILGGSSSGLLEMAARIALTHHEKYDGTGYPNNLHGDEIPIEGRIVAVADVFDALTTARRYKRAWTTDEAREEMKDQRGRHFDPELVDRFFEAPEEIEAIQEKYRDTA